MTVKLAILKSGEDVIADIKEIISNDNVIGYLFKKPCVAEMMVEDGDDEKPTYKIRMLPWIPLGKTTEVPVTAEWVITIVDPIDSLEKMYTKDVLNNDQDDNSDEQSDSDFTD